MCNVSNWYCRSMLLYPGRKHYISEQPIFYKFEEKLSCFVSFYLLKKRLTPDGRDEVRDAMFWPNIMKSRICIS